MIRNVYAVVYMYTDNQGKPPEFCDLKWIFGNKDEVHTYAEQLMHEKENELKKELGAPDMVVTWFRDYDWTYVVRNAVTYEHHIFKVDTYMVDFGDEYQYDPSQLYAETEESR